MQNGVYEITQQGTASLPYILTRVTEADTSAELDDLVVTAALGTTNKGIPYGQQTNNPIIGTNNIVFTATGIYMRQQTSGTQAINQIPVYTATGLTQTKGTANFKYNPANDLFTIRGIDYTFPANNGDASQVLTTDGAGNLSWATGGGGSPAGSDTWIQYNNAGSFGADAGFTRDVATGNTNIAATTGVNTFGFKLDNNILGAGFSGSVLSASDTGGDSLVSGLFDYAGVPSWIDFYAYADGNAFQSFKTKNVYSFALANATGSTVYTSSSNTFTLASNLSGAGGQGISQSGGITSIGNVSGATGNNTKITIDDVNEHITISNLPAYDDDTAAGVGGLTAGMVYMTTGSGSAPLNAAGILMIKQ